ncbi:membrane protein [Desulfosarcina ovata subsp. sediminis]|uniref:Membrane protein n=1 Tax=Desulfosarcina ovata subsp. sediminis TaxID=885957 RepID=A0A5K7ZFA4_9BACT|nr:DUF4236 domain-containing protein [Desulfosarcina ovata]BBO79636.1 membrane protein [Desulfosarcina ovata subsp. sediminis]
MAFYIRKSLKFGPVRFNLSKSGVGVSAGIKGFRLGSGPRGNYVHMGRGGLYYRATLPSGKSKKSSQSVHLKNDNDASPKYPDPTSIKIDDIVMEDIDSGDIGQIVDSSSSSLVNEINEKQMKIRLTPIFFILGLAITLFSPVAGEYKAIFFFATIILSIVLNIFDKNRKTTVIFYEIEKEAEDLLKGVYNAFEKLKNSRKIWHISSKGDIKDSKYHAGANQAVKRNTVQIGFSNPKFIKTNIPTPSIPVGSQTVYFFPDKILIFEKNKVGGLSYMNVKFQISKTHFVEEESVPKDAKIVGQTWRYVNKRGGPDKRFKDNRQIPIAEYETVHMASDSGLNEMIHISKVDQFKEVDSAIEAIKNFK